MIVFQIQLPIPLSESQILLIAPVIVFQIQFPNPESVPSGSLINETIVFQIHVPIPINIASAILNVDVSVCHNHGPNAIIKSVINLKPSPIFSLNYDAKFGSAFPSQFMNVVQVSDILSLKYPIAIFNSPPRSIRNPTGSLMK